MMLNGIEVLAASLGLLVVIWAFILGFSRAFGSPPEH
jgi:hypothetical protein